MDWQQLSALVIVAATAVAFLVARLFPRRPRWARPSPCGCNAQSIGPNPPRIIVRSRRGDARQTIIQTQ